MSDTQYIDLNSSITKLVTRHILSNDVKYGNRVSDILDALHTLLNGEFVKYSFFDKKLSGSFVTELSSDSFQSILSNINEKQSHQKVKGVYYTPKDVTQYLASNVFVNFIDSTNKSVQSDTKSIARILQSETPTLRKLINSSVFDPTSGAGEFLLSALELKFEISEKGIGYLSDDNYIDIASTIHGNDIDQESIEIAKIRLFFATLIKIKDSSKLHRLSIVLNNNFSKIDFVCGDTSIFPKFDIIIGNPPYVEYGKVPTKPKNNYGNIYADVLHNSSLLLKKKGVMSFVIPISYAATSRMHKIREVLLVNTPKQFVLNYADRPDCFFTSVHQKLTLLIACKHSVRPQIYTSGYRYWYKSERRELLDGCQMMLNSSAIKEYIPKIANQIEMSIFEKIHTIKGDTISSLSSDVISKYPVYLNMRGCFWMKAFSFNPGSNEYKQLYYDEILQSYILCILNSSLFFLFWTMISDCWHVTNKELSSFRVPTQDIDCTLFSRLAKNLENRLEETKQFIGSKQTEYAYKHKNCKPEIDAIDEALCSLYLFTDEELQYIKRYNLRYRMSEK